MEKYNPQEIEKKWQEIWRQLELFKGEDYSKKPKYYVLVEFPYPSGEGLHVGHCRSYIGLDIFSRKKRMEGFNVLFPMGWDAFGLPTENYALKTRIHPVIVTKKNTANFKRQQQKIGLSFDWSREINTTDPSYYKWTQWIFIQLFKKGLAYKAKMSINWCPICKIGLANEEVVNGNCERCGAKVVRKEKEQWLLKITKYAERLIEDLDKVDYPERVKTSQKEWIGRSEGWEIKFKIKNRASIYGSEGEEEDEVLFAYQKLKIKNEILVFTTRVDTLSGATYLVLAPEHPIIRNLKFKIENLKFVEKYIEEAKKKTELERISETKEKSGIEIKGIKAINPANGREIPIFVADYILLHYGTGAIMAVPCHDRRDFDFARKYNLPVIEVIKPSQIKKVLPKKAPLVVSNGRFEKAYEGEGFLINSGRFTGLSSQKAKERIGEWLVKGGLPSTTFQQKGFGKGDTQKVVLSLAQKVTYYKLRDWIFSRQRYWGEPIPMINCQKCGWVSVKEKDLPVKLPEVKEYKPTESGESPLAAISEWVNVVCPECGGAGRRETDVMPNWAGSNWYYLRYCDPKNDKKLAESKLLNYWMPVDWYNGGPEHITLHLLYSRFIYKFLWDIGAVPMSVGPEPYKKRTTHGTVLGEGGIKMSKSKGNTINPEEVVKEYGADAMRIYEMFMGPFEQMIPWDIKGIKGTRRFLEKIWTMVIQNINHSKIKTPPELKSNLHKTIKKVTEDINSLKFNTAISSLMEFCNYWQRDKEGLGEKEFKDFLKVLSPFAPHITEEIWQKAGFKDLCLNQKWPKYNSKLIKEEKTTLVIQINGRIRDKIEVQTSFSENEAREIALSREKIKKWVEGKEIKKVIFVPGKLINIVI